MNACDCICVVVGGVAIMMLYWLLFFGVWCNMVGGWRLLVIYCDYLWLWLTACFVIVAECGVRLFCCCWMLMLWICLLLLRVFAISGVWGCMFVALRFSNLYD